MKPSHLIRSDSPCNLHLSEFSGHRLKGRGPLTSVVNPCGPTHIYKTENDRSRLRLLQTIIPSLSNTEAAEQRGKKSLNNTEAILQRTLVMCDLVIN